MSEYIERKVLLKAVEKMDRLDKETKPPYEYNKQGYLLLIKAAPASDVVEIKHGKWLNHYLSGTVVKEGFVSSCCDMWNASETPYCPYCGAKMDESEVKK